MKLEKIYKVTPWYTIAFAIPCREAKNTIVFSEHVDATNNRIRVPKSEYANMPRSPQEAIDQYRNYLQKKIEKLENEISKLDTLERKIKNE